MKSFSNNSNKPEKVAMSLAAAMALRLVPGRFYRDASTGCINLLTTNGIKCAANCAYCGLARERASTEDEKTFIRVGWPLVSSEEVLTRLVRYEDRLSRVCVSMQNTTDSADHASWLISEVKKNTTLPVSALIMPSLCRNGGLKSLKQSGADMIGVGIDAASERVFELKRGSRVKGGLKWQDYMDVALEARKVFGKQKVNAHIVVGLGETDKELVELFEFLVKNEIRPFLFSFYPEKGSRMENSRRPSVKRYRTLKLVKYMIEERRISANVIKFNHSGKIIGIGISWAETEAAIEDGAAFMTDGCPKADGGLACNRPFGGYRPGEAFRDFPFAPLAEDKIEIRRSLGKREVLK